MISFISHVMWYKHQVNVKKFETNLKKYTGAITKSNARISNIINNYKRSIRFDDIGEDILFFEPYSVELEKELISKNYKETTYQEYPFINPNSYFTILPAEGNVINNLSDSFEFDGDRYDISYHDNEFFFSLGGEVFLHFMLKPEYKILFAAVDEELFLNFFVEAYENGVPYTYYIKTHLSYDFFNYDYENIPYTHFDEMEYTHFIKIPKYSSPGIPFFDLSRMNIIGADFSAICFNVGHLVYRLAFSKRVYFKHNNLIYKTLRPEEAKSLTLDRSKVIRVEHPYFYDLIELFGFNELKDFATLTTYDALHFQNYKFEFGNHLNGFYNYFNFRIRKDYYLTINKNFFQIIGNFNYKNLLGNFEITLNYYTDDKCYARLYHENILVDETRLFFVDEVAHFKNLKIYKKFVSTGFNFQETVKFTVKNEYEYFMDFVEHNENYDEISIGKINRMSHEYLINNKYLKNDEGSNKKEPAQLIPYNGNLFVSPFIKDSITRNSLTYKSIPLLDGDKVSPLWFSLGNKSHTLIDEVYVVDKTIKIQENQDPAFQIKKKSFNLNLSEVFNSNV